MGSEAFSNGLTGEVDPSEDQVVGVDGVEVLIEQHVVVVETHHFERFDLRDQRDVLLRTIS